MIPYVKASPRDPRYFELTDGTPYIPIGFNLMGAPEPDEMERVVATMARYRVNFCRIWLDYPPWNVEHERSGVYDEGKAPLLDRFMELCRAQGIRVKMCVEWFRSILPERPDPPVNGQFPKILHHVKNGGLHVDMKDYVGSERGRAQYAAKLQWYADRYGDDPYIFAWELWNEMNAVGEGWEPWTRAMLPELHRIFPRNLAVQSLGSYDTESAGVSYDEMCRIPGNDVVQVHRYLDQGAQLDICKGPVDLLCADAVRSMRTLAPDRPILLAEVGAVKPSHTGTSELYEKDPEGTLLHDMLFAPFFAGAAGPGHVWHWRDAIDKPDHWRHFARFAEAVDNIDVASQDFTPVMIDHPRLRVYALRGPRTWIAWARDSQATWQTELSEGTPAQRLVDEVIELPAGFPATPVRAYDPWTGEWVSLRQDGSRLRVPAFTRSLVLRGE